MTTLQGRLSSLITSVGTDVKALQAKLTTVVAVSTSTWSLDLTYTDRIVESSNASATTVTVAPNSTYAHPIGTQVEIVQMGAGQITLSPGAGVSLRSRGAALKTAGQYSVIGLRKRATDEWVVMGDLTT